MKGSTLQFPLLMMMTIPLIFPAYVKANTACCSFPCQNNGICSPTGRNGYICNCQNSGYYGTNCEYATWKHWFLSFFQLLPEDIHSLLVGIPGFGCLLNMLPCRSLISKFLMQFRIGGYIHTLSYSMTVTNANDESMSLQILPSVPMNCPTPLGVVGESILPPIDDVMPLFMRSMFKPDPMGSNLLFATQADHLSHLFLKTGFSSLSEVSAMGYVYGETDRDNYLLRNHTNGKLKSQIINGEEWPPFVFESPVDMQYPTGLPQTSQFALGYEYYSLHSGHLMWSTLWLRQHNLFCDILTVEHPDWTDEQLHQAARTAVLAMNIKIIVEEYIAHMARYYYNYVYTPEAVFQDGAQCKEFMLEEFKLLLHWHQMLPDQIAFNGTAYDMKDFLFQSQFLIQFGIGPYVEALIKQSAGRVTHHNHGPATILHARQALLHARTLRLQSYNNYLRHFKLKTPKTFIELTGDWATAKELEELYGDVEAVEFIIGVLCARRAPHAMFNLMVQEAGALLSLQSLQSSLLYMKARGLLDNYGSIVVNNIVSTASYANLICSNIKQPCPPVTLFVPWWDHYYEESFNLAEWDAEEKGCELSEF
ncbi:prostaglandin G/H synthase 1-like [Octopus sinensis]|nr:prostaglandin G/H synthase 1-like [Octopus sinensis]